MCCVLYQLHYFFQLGYPTCLHLLFIPSFLYCWPARFILLIIIRNSSQGSFFRHSTALRTTVISLSSFMICFLISWYDNNCVCVHVLVYIYIYIHHVYIYPLFCIFTMLPHCNLARSHLFIFTCLSNFFYSFSNCSVCVIHHFERIGGQINIFDTYWFTVVTFSTVGYGDVSPGHWTGKVFMILFIVSALIYLPSKV